MSRPGRPSEVAVAIRDVDRIVGSARSRDRRARPAPACRSSRPRPSARAAYARDAEPCFVDRHLEVRSREPHLDRQRLAVRRARVEIGRDRERHAGGAQRGDRRHRQPQLHARARQHHGDRAGPRERRDARRRYVLEVIGRQARRIRRAARRRRDRRAGRCGRAPASPRARAASQIARASASVNAPSSHHTSTDAARVGARDPGVADLAYERGAIGAALGWHEVGKQGRHAADRRMRSRPRSRRRGRARHRSSARNPTSPRPSSCLRGASRRAARAGSRRACRRRPPRASGRVIAAIPPPAAAIS